jgi:hypothetical protein
MLDMWGEAIMGKRGPKKGSGGRPKFEIDFEEFEKLCAIQCTLIEIANWFKTTEDTIEARVKDNYDGKTFSDVYKKYSAEGKMSLRRNQFKMSETNPAMAIWLGKQYLDQKDKSEVDTKVTNVSINIDSDDSKL